MPKVLLIGQDFRLLATRAAVLAKTNASIVCGNAVESLKVLETETFDLVVLCHSLSEKQITEISDVVHRRLPGIRILQVVSNVGQERIYHGTEFDAASLPDPNRLIRRTAELLRGLPNHKIAESVHAELRQAAS